MEFLESLTKLSESDQQKIFETLQILKNVKANITSKDSVSTSGENSKELSNNIPEKPVSKQKTLDSWIVKSKTPPSTCKKKMTFPTETISIAEAGESSRTIDYENVSHTLQNLQVSSNPPTPIEKSIIPEKEINTNEKCLSVLLNRQECFVSKQKSPEHINFSSEKRFISPLEINVPGACKNQVLVSENSDQTVHSPEKHFSVPARSYNLRSARGVSDEKSNSKTSNLSSCISDKTDKSEKTDKINKSDHKAFIKHKPTSKECPEEVVSSNSITGFEELKCDEETDLCNNKMSKENINNSDDTASMVVQSELEQKVIDINENLMLTELDAAVIVKGKHKRTCKNKESKKSSVSNSALDSSSIQESVTNERIIMKMKNSQVTPSEKDTKSNYVDANPSEILNEKEIQVHKNVYSSPGQKQNSANVFVKSITKQKAKKNIKSNDDSSILHEKTKLDSGLRSKVKEKNLPIEEINSNTNKNINFEKGNSNNELESQSNVCTGKTEELSKKDANNKIIVNSSFKRISRKVGNKYKNILARTRSPDSELTPKNNEDIVEISQIQNKETEELLIKDTNNRISQNLGSKRTSKKAGTKNENICAMNIPHDPGLTSENNQDTIISTEISANVLPTQNEEFAKGTEELLTKDTNIISVNLCSKKTGKKANIKNKSISHRNASSDSGLSPKINQDTITSFEISAKSSPTQNKESVSEAEEQLFKDTSNKISMKLSSKKMSRKAGNKSASPRNASSDSGLSPKNNQHTVVSFDLSANISPTQNKKSAKENEVLLTKDMNEGISGNLGSKRTNRKACDKNKSVSPRNASSDLGLTCKINQDSITSFEISAKSLPTQTEEFLIKDMNDEISINLGSKKTSGKGSNKNKSILPKTNSPDSRLASKSNPDAVTSFEISAKSSPTQTKESVMETEELLIKDTNNKISKRTSRKAGNKNILPKIVSSDLGLSPKNNQDTIMSFDLSENISPTQNKAKETEESLTKDINDGISVNLGSKRTYRKARNKNIISGSSLDLELTLKNNKDAIKTSSIQNKETEELLTKDTNDSIFLDLGSKRTSRKAGTKNKNISAMNIPPDSELTSENNQDIIISTEISENILPTEKLLTKDTNNSISLNLGSKRTTRKAGNKNKSISPTATSSESGLALENNQDSIISTKISANILPTQNREYSKETAELFTQDIKSGNSKRICRKKDTKNKSIVITKNNILLNPNENDSIISTNTSLINSVNSSSQCNDSVKETGELLTKDINTITSVNFVSKKRSKRRGSENKSIITTKKSLLSNSEQDSKNKHKDCIISLGILSKDSLSLITEDISLKSTSPIKNTSTHEKITHSVNQNKCSQSIISEESGAFHTELNSLNEIEDLPEDQSQKFSVVSTKTPEKIDNTSSHPEECPKFSSVSKKVNTLKRKTVVQSSESSKKKLKSSKYEENQPNTSQIFSDNLNTELENSELIFIKGGSKKKAKSSKQNDIIDSNKVRSSTRTAKDSNSNIIKEPKHKCLKDSKSKNLLDQSQKEKKSVKNSKNDSESFSKKKTNSTESQAVGDFNLSENEHNFEAYCKVKSVLEAIGISIEELFEIPEMTDSLNSEQPDGVFFISKCKSDSKISVYLHESKTELKNILDDLKKEYTDINK